jgi:hypothetical protein
MHVPHGLARLSDDKKTLTITTKVKRGKKMVDLVRTFAVKDVNPHPNVANPAFELTGTHGKVYHCGRNKFGYFCDCVNGEIREKYGAWSPCKHCVGMIAVGLLPKGRHDNREEEAPQEDAEREGD